MKELLTIVSLVISGVWAEPPAPYSPSGWRPNGPTLELPQRVPAQNPQTNYLPPLDPRNKTPIKQQEYLPSRQEYGAPAAPDVELSVQGLPQQEQVPIFKLSPINGKQYVGPDFNKDIRRLDQSSKQSQVQNQQNIYRQFTRQRQLEAAQSNNNPNGLPAFQSPNHFARTSPKPQTTFTTVKPEERTTTEVTTEFSLNEGETVDDSAESKKRVSVEVAKQNIQEFPPELYLNPLAQIQLQPQLVPIQFGQFRTYPEQAPQKQVSGYDAETHFAALPSVLAQQQLAQQQLAQQQLFQQQLAQQQVQNQPQGILVQPQALPVQPQFVPQPQLQGRNPYLVPQQGAVEQSHQPDQYDSQMFPQIQAQPVFVQQPDQPEQNADKERPQFVFQYQQPQYQVPQYQNPQYQYPQYQVPQYPQKIILPNQYQQQGQQTQGQDNLQSGLNVSREENDIDQPEQNNEHDGATATAVATTFGARTQPRLYTRYGAPEPVPNFQTNPGYQTATDSEDKAEADDGQTVAEATAVARGSRRKVAKLRNRRVRPVFTLDKSGHLVLDQDQ